MVQDAVTIQALLIGAVAQFGPRGEASAIVKHPVAGPCHVGWRGIEGDAQADLRVHGGPDKALHHYPRDHYAWWRDRLDGERGAAVAVLDDAGAFGENISTIGLTEETVCLGDRYRLGSALVEVCQGRQPCWKQAHRLRDARTVAMMVDSGRTGWYYRVVKDGQVSAGDALTLLERPLPAWSVARVTGVIVAGRERNANVLSTLVATEVLAAGWRSRAAQLARNL